MPQLNLHLADGPFERLKRTAERAGVPLQTYAAHLFSKKVRMATSTAPAEMPTINRAVDILLSFLPPAYRDVMASCAGDTGESMAAYMLSHLHLIYERGETSYLMGEYAESVKAGTAADVNLLPDSSRCEYCKHSFVPERKGQRYCPPPADGTESCGRKAGLELVHAKRDFDSANIASQYKPPTPHFNTQEQIEVMLRAPGQTLAEASAETPVEEVAHES